MLESTIKKLYGCSYNECAHPDCEAKIVEFDSATGQWVNYGEVAHIHGRKAGSERYDETLIVAGTVDGFGNLMILCGRHHTQIDQRGAGATYTADLLRNWKAEHTLKKQAEHDGEREWVFGGQTLSFTVGCERVTLSYWHDADGNLQFYSPEQLEEVAALRDASLWLSQIGSLLRLIESVSGEPDNPSRVTQNDNLVRMLKQAVQRLHRGGAGGLERFYRNLRRSPNATLRELAEVGTVDRQMKTTILVGRATPERLTSALTEVDKKS